MTETESWASRSVEAAEVEAASITPSEVESVACALHEELVDALPHAANGWTTEPVFRVEPQMNPSLVRGQEIPGI